MTPGVRSASVFRRLRAGLRLLLCTWMLCQGWNLWAQSSVPSPRPTSQPSTTGLPAALPLRRDPETPMGASGLGVMRAFALVLVLAGGVAWGLKRYLNARNSGPAQPSFRTWRHWLLSPGNRQEGFQVIQSRRLTSRASLHLLHWDGKEWLLGCTDQGMLVLGQRAQTEASPESPKGDA